MDRVALLQYIMRLLVALGNHDHYVAKPYKVAIGTCMKKILRIIFTLITREETFTYSA